MVAFQRDVGGTSNTGAGDSPLCGHCDVQVRPGVTHCSASYTLPVFDIVMIRSDCLHR